MTTPDLSLKESFQQRRVNPLLGVHQLAAAGSALDFRSLIPPPPPGGETETGGGTGGTGGGPNGEPDWLRIDLKNMEATDLESGTLMLCSTTELFCQVDAGGTHVNAQGEPAVLGDSYWIGAVVHFPVVAPWFFAGALPNQNFRFQITTLLPDGTAPTPDNTLWWREEDEDEQLPLDQALQFATPNSPAPQGRAWTLLLWSSFILGHLSLRRGRKLALALCVKSSLPFAPGQLGLEVRSEVGWLLGVGHVPANWGEGDTINFDTVYKCVWCVNCQRMVSLAPPYVSKCSNCGATGTYIMKPVAPESIDLSEPWGM